MRYTRAMSLTAILYAGAAGIIPSLIWLFFWIREDKNHPEPRFLLAAAFFGGMVAVTIAILGEKFTADLIVDQSVRYISWAAIEETVKFIAVAMIALASVYNDEPIDAMIYCITAALGFAALENALFILSPLSDGEIARSLLTGNMRFMGATLVHVVSSAMVGFALGFAFYRGFIAKVSWAIIGLTAAIAIHAAFNLSIVNAAASDALRTFGWVWGAVVLLIVLFEEVKAVRLRFW